MKKIAIIVLVLIGVSVVAFSYRAYKNKVATELAARRAMLDERENEARQRAAAKQEAQRLAALQAEQAAAEEARKLAEMRQEEVAAEQQRAAAEAEITRLNRGFEELRQQREAAIMMGQTSAEKRQAELAAIAAAENAAMEKLHTIESEKAQLASRETAHAAALQHQIELEKLAQERAARYRASQPR